MNDTITVNGIVATAPRHLLTDTGLDITSFRLASPSRRWDRHTGSWTAGDTNWYTVTAFRTLAANVGESVGKGDRVVVAGRLRVRQWERDDRSGTTVEIDADTIGHDLGYGRASWHREPRQGLEVAAEASQRSDIEADAATGVAAGEPRTSAGASVDILPAGAGTDDAGDPGSIGWPAAAL